MIILISIIDFFFKLDEVVLHVVKKRMENRKNNNNKNIIRHIKFGITPKK